MLRWWNCRGVCGHASAAAGLSLSFAWKAGHFRVTAASYRPPSFGFAATANTTAFALADGDWFYFSGIWRPVMRDWPESHAILTTEANADVAPFHDRQMAVLRRGDRMRWLDYGDEENNLLKPLPAGMFMDALLVRLGLALAIGLLVGLERGWRERDAPDRSRTAGIRTYGISGLLGGTFAALAESLDAVSVLVAGFLGFAAVFALYKAREAAHDDCPAIQRIALDTPTPKRAAA